jgi:hypothetical protein
VAWEDELYRVNTVIAEVRPDGTIQRAGKPVYLLANDAGLSVEGLQWKVTVAGMKPFWFNAPEDGVTVDLNDLAPVAELPVTVNTATLIQDAVNAAVIASVEDLVDSKQPLDTDLTAVAALATTSFGRNLLTLTNAAAARTAIAAAFPDDVVVTYDGSGNVDTVTEDGVTTTYTYNLDGTVDTDTRLGVTREYTYDGSGNLTGIEAV